MEVMDGMAEKGGAVVEEIAVEAVTLEKAAEVVVVRMAVEGEDEGIAAEEVMVEMMDVVTVEVTSC